MQFSVETKVSEIYIPDAIQTLEELEKEWNRLFDNWTEDAFSDLFGGDLAGHICDYFYSRDCDCTFDWCGDDLIVDVSSVAEDYVNEFQKKLKSIVNCLPLCEISHFQLEGEDGDLFICAYNEEGGESGTLRFISMEDESDDDDDESEIAETRTSQGNDFIDIFDPQPTVSLAPVTEPTNSEEAALAALKWLGEKFNVPTSDER